MTTSIGGQSRVGPAEARSSAASTETKPSLQSLFTRLTSVESRVQSAVARRRMQDPDPDDRFRGLYISEAQVDGLLAPQLHAEGTTQATVPRLEKLAAEFALDEVDIELLLVAIAPDLDHRFERLYGYLHDDVSRRRSSIGLALELCAQSASDPAARRRLSGEGRLVSGRLLVLEDGDRPFLTRTLRVPDRVCAYLLGDDVLETQVAALQVAEPPAAPPNRRLELALSKGGRLVYVRELAGTEAALAGALVLDLNRLPPEADPVDVASLAGREARLLGQILVAGPVEALASRGVQAVRAFAELHCQVVLTGARHWDPAWSSQVPILCEASAPVVAERAELWRGGLDGSGFDVDPSAVIYQFRLSPSQIKRAAEAARLHAAADDREVAPADLVAGARAQNAAGLERLARRIEPAVCFGDLVVPGETLDQLRELTARARYRDRVLGDWGMGGPASRRKGLTALFAGESGTGKSMAAEVVAGELGLDLYAIDLSTVVDKYIGETEKNLDRIFSGAEGVNGVLLFDEADALFGKRSEVSDAHDRYANVEISFLLQRMELFDGVAILATNLRSNLDEAFARRLDAVVDFPEPEIELRRQLWEKCLGQLVPRAPDIDLDFLAAAFKLSGGNIRNVALAAAYLAAVEPRPVRMADLIRATHGEYRKLGRMSVEAEFGQYYNLIARPEPGSNGRGG